MYRIKRILMAFVFVLTTTTLASVPAVAQVEFSGEWSTRQHEDSLERMPGPTIGEYVGIPLTDAARKAGDTWDPDLLTLPEHQCIPHPSDYGPSFSNLRIWKDKDPLTQQVTAWHTMVQWMAPLRTIWMDGRTHPPEYAAHTWQGFSTGKWEGNILTVNTTHLKKAWIRRNGVPRSDKATVAERFIRHGDVLTWVTIVDDPLYLTEPFIRSRNFVLDPNQSFGNYPCGPFDIVDEVSRPAGTVPHRSPETNPDLNEITNQYGIPLEAVRGGAETMYPDYQIKLKQSLTKPAAAQ
jgi:hypothetical protein